MTKQREKKEGAAREESGEKKGRQRKRDSKRAT